METDEGNNTDSVTVSMGASGIDLVAATMIDNPDPVNPGQVLTYTSTVQNTGTDDATSVLIRQLLPSSGFDFVGASASEGFNCTFTPTNTVNCNGDLDAGHTTTITVQLLITAAAPSSLSSTLTADPSGTITEMDETNNAKSAVTTVAAAPCTSCVDLVQGSIIDTPDPVANGGTLSYSFAVGNAGDLTATGVILNATVDTTKLNPLSITASLRAAGRARCSSSPRCTAPGPARAVFSQGRGSSSPSPGR